MPVINGVYLKDFPALPSSVADANIIPIAISGNQIAYRTTVAGIVTDARVTSKLLTGLSVTGSTILATDTILQAFGKVQNQLNGKVSSVGLTMPAAFFCVKVRMFKAWSTFLPRIKSATKRPLSTDKRTPRRTARVSIAAPYFFWTFLSAGWPLKVRVKANSPNL